MDQLLSLFYRITTLLEELQREQGVPLGPIRLGALWTLVTTFCNLANTLTLGTDLWPASKVGKLGSTRLELWERFRQSGEPFLGPCSEREEEDVLSLPDSLPDLVDEEQGEERPPLTSLVGKGVIPQGLALRQDRTKPHRF